MKNQTLIPLLQCLDVNLRDKNSVDITALHETGHLIVMYALDLMDSLSYITTKAGSHTNETSGMTDEVKGLTEVTSEYKTLLNQYADELQIAGIPNSGKSITELMRKTKIKGAKLYLPNICRLFGGGAICRYYEVPNEDICKIDYDFINALLMGLGITGTIDDVRKMVDMYLDSIFTSFDILTKAIYKNLKQSGYLSKEQVMHIIGEWESFKWG